MRFSEKFGRVASEDVLLQLLKLKCITILLHALEVCQLPRRDLQSLDIIVNNFFNEIVSNKRYVYNKVLSRNI